MAIMIMFALMSDDWVVNENDCKVRRKERRAGGRSGFPSFFSGDRERSRRQDFHRSRGNRQ